MAQEVSEGKARPPVAAAEALVDRIGDDRSQPPVNVPDALPSQTPLGLFYLVARPGKARSNGEPGSAGAARPRACRTAADNRQARR